MIIRTLFSFFFYLLSKSRYGDKYSKTTKARNLKFGHMISIYINLHPSNFGDATSRDLGQMHPKLVTAKFIKTAIFTHVCARAVVAEWLKAPVVEI